jgi:hypothetical protein
MEIISVHPARKQERIRALEICGKIRVGKKNGESAKLKIYGSNFSPELNIHINWTSRSPFDGKSRLGCELCRALSDLGLVSHTLWVEYDLSLPDKNGP